VGNALNRIYDGVLRLIGDYAIDETLSNAGTVAVCYSGGADSTALLHLMLMLRERYGFSVAAVHVNHMLRGDESDGDQRFCTDTCRSLGVPLYTARLNAGAYSRDHSLSGEEGARQVRYRFFENVMAELEESGGAPVIAVTAHNCDDNMETVLFNLCRGAGTKGAAGIPCVRGRYIRPLLYASSDDIRLCCAQEGWQYVTDSTNLSDDYTRNRLRHRITPALKELFPAAGESVSRACLALRRDSEYLDSEARRAMANAAVCGKIKRSSLAAMHDALLTRVIGMICAEAGGSELSMKHYSIAADFIRGGGSGTLDMPGGILLRCDDCVSAEKRGSAAKAKISPSPLHLDTPDGPEEYEKINKISIHTTVDFDKISGELYIRSRLPGDKYFYGGVNRTVKKLLCDSGLTVAQRDALPIICDGAGILWIPGFPPRGCGKKSGDGAAAHPVRLAYSVINETSQE
jgi:tRNA(Ile)-lysidine synthase